MLVKQKVLGLRNLMCAKQELFTQKLKLNNMLEGKSTWTKMYFTLGGFQTAQEQTFHFNMNNKSIMFKCILYAELENNIRLIRYLQKSYGCCK